MRDLAGRAAVCQDCDEVTIWASNSDHTGSKHIIRVKFIQGDELGIIVESDPDENHPRAWLECVWSEDLTARKRTSRSEEEVMELAYR